MDNGVINFDDLYSKDHNCRYYLLKETKVPEGHRSSLTATDGSMQFEYVPASDENVAGGVIINRGGMDADSSVWQSRCVRRLEGDHHRAVDRVQGE